MSGSLWPSVLAHFANNGIALVITFLTADVSQDVELPLPLALGGTTLTVIVFWLGQRWAPRAPTNSTPDGVRH